MIGSAFLLSLSACQVGPGIVCDYVPSSLFFIKRVTGSNELIPEVSLSNFTFEGTASVPEALFEADEIYNYAGSNATIDGGTVSCAPVCEFGFDAAEGAYAFDLSAPGYSTKRITVGAEYQPVRSPAQCAPDRAPVKLELSLGPSAS